MAKEKITNNFSFSDLAKYLLVFGIIAFLSFLFPNNARFHYDFELGQTWRYDDLLAPFDFPVRKSEEELKVEKEKLLQNFSPYYVVNTDISRQQIKKFEEEFAKDFAAIDQNQFTDVARNPEKYIQFGQKFLERQFRKGIISLDVNHQEKSPDFVINIVLGRNTRKQTLQNISSIQSVEEIIQDSLPYASLRDPDFLYYPLKKSLQANLFYSESVTNLFKEDLISSVSTSRGKVSKGDLIIPKDGIITDDIYERLLSFRTEYEEEITANKSHLGVFSGYLLLTTISILIFLVYIKFYLPEIFEKFNKFGFIFMWFAIFGWIVWLVETNTSLSIWFIPFCVVPIVIKTFFNDRLAFFTHVVLILIVSFLCSEGYEFIFLQTLAGIVAIMSDANSRNWSGFFFTMLFIFLTYAMGWLGLSLIINGSIYTVDYSVLGSLLLNVFLTLMAFPLIPLLERVFGFTSAASLLELSDMHRPLLKRLALEAPGTLQHSIQVANLCEAVADEIGADELLVKTAALYHDIGKIPKAAFFIENQGGRNPHEDLNELESAEMIINHITEGLLMAKKAGLPMIIRRFIASHHGTTRVEYFYRNYVKKHPGEVVLEEKFRYPGPKPVSKEETILMLADSMEASCKSLKNPTGEDIDKMVESIIKNKVETQQLTESEMTFEEMNKAKLVFKKLLRSMNHVRVEYPEEED
jgi:putative nucleotidyltransferase with HDIG domain